jgi:thioester reductase-like protein
MQYFITGASGFIGRRLVKKLLAREDSTLYFLVRATEKESLANLYDFWECDAKRAIPVIGDLTEPLLGVAAVDRKKLGKKTTHFFHLAAIYDLLPMIFSLGERGGHAQYGEICRSDWRKHFHLFSSIASAGMFEGLFQKHVRRTGSPLLQDKT